MKNYILNLTKLKEVSLLVIMPLVMLACSTDTAKNNNEEVNNPPGAKQLIQKIEKQNPQSFEKASQFFYENNKPIYVYLDNCSGTLYYYEYNTNDKVSRRYEGTTTLNTDTFDPDTFDLGTFKQNSVILNFVYDGDKLTKMQSDDGFIDYQFSYNNDGTLKTVEWFIRGIGLWTKVALTYSGGKINNLNNIEHSTTGAVIRNDNYTFEYDDKTNPLYEIANTYGLLSLFTCTGLDYISSMDGGYKIFKNNVTKVTRDGDIIFSATYEYNENNYPTRISYTNFIGNYSEVQLISYLE